MVILPLINLELDFLCFTILLPPLPVYHSMGKPHSLPENVSPQKHDFFNHSSKNASCATVNLENKYGKSLLSG